MEMLAELTSAVMNQSKFLMSKLALGDSKRNDKYQK
jgi:hypothetical protein